MFSKQRYFIVRSRLCVCPRSVPSCESGGRTVCRKIRTRTVVLRRRRTASVPTTLVCTCTIGRNRSDTRTAVGMFSKWCNIIECSRLCVVTRSASSCESGGRTVCRRTHTRTVVPCRRRTANVAPALVCTCTTGRNRSDT
uniref:Uncharacterized protein n=1 Tax=Sipha flava TaxID=143950 RepID=A0A2S2R996_9HEMI